MSPKRQTGASAPDRSTRDIKRDPHPTDNTEKDPSDWVSGDEPMTGAQASYLKTLSEQAHDPDAFDPGLTKAEASRRIDSLKERLATAGNRRAD